MLRRSSEIRLRAVSCLLALATGACSSFIGRASAPDEAHLPALVGEDLVARAPGPTVLVHIDSAYPATLARLGDDEIVVERCTAPCDRNLPLDGTYRIDGPQIRSTWPFQLERPEAPGDRVVLHVSPRLRSTYATAKIVCDVGLVAMGVGFAFLVGGALAETSAADANNGGPAPCAGCTAATVGGAVVALAGAVVGTVGAVMGLTNLSSATSQQLETPATQRIELPRQASTWRAPGPAEAALPRATEAPLLHLSF